MEATAAGFDTAGRARPLVAVACAMLLVVFGGCHWCPLTLACIIHSSSPLNFFLHSLQTTFFLAIYGGEQSKYHSRFKRRDAQRPTAAHEVAKRTLNGAGSHVQGLTHPQYMQHIVVHTVPQLAPRTSRCSHRSASKMI